MAVCFVDRRQCGMRSERCKKKLPVVYFQTTVGIRFKHFFEKNNMNPRVVVGADKTCEISVKISIVCKRNQLGVSQTQKQSRLVSKYARGTSTISLLVMREPSNLLKYFIRNQCFS
uniref:Uncharacterized protein n=1 Tax=Mesocestoides corti TaxID=53468 RepID=A0A5K3EFS2_MESCO